MADLTRADELVRTIERDAAFQAEVKSAPTMTAKREVLDAHGFQDIGLDDMKAYVESKGGKLTVPEGGRELTEQELAAVSGGALEDLSEAEIVLISVGGAGAIGIGVAAAGAV